eukprot:TRINITY_DN37937_c0_g1_i1.p1 TRINITY_DN37937_c0_g1~~TRINITY_DN37937_c0_g1_i1.p1  ORF type:complete len:1143 (-),score=322.28 TRINITY_DN37937_c0_g1_i1:53-3481(-)
MSTFSSVLPSPRAYPPQPRQFQGQGRNVSAPPKSRNAKLPAIAAASPRQHLASQQDDDTKGDLGETSILPQELHVALDSVISTLAVEEWSKAASDSTRGNGKGSNHQKRVESYESPLLYCEAQLRRLDRLSAKLRLPSPVLTASVYDLLTQALETLPIALQQPCRELLKFVEDAIYSGEEATAEDLRQIREVVPKPVKKLAHFQAARRQQLLLEQAKQTTLEMQEVVDAHLARRRQVVQFVMHLQAEERRLLQGWLFRYWVTTFQMRKVRMARSAGVVLISTADVTGPFVSWRLYVSMMRLERAKADCAKVDKAASDVANQITEVEMEKEAQQQRLQDCLQASSGLAAQCKQEQEEHARLQRLWDVTQPELVLSVLSQSLEFFFELVIREARLTSLHRKQRLQKRDVSVLATGLQESHEALRTMHGEALVLCWLQFCFEEAQTIAEKALKAGDLDSLSKERWKLVAQRREISNLAEDLADGVVLAAVVGMLKSQRDGNAQRLVAGDLWPLDERDPELRCGQVCTIIGALVPNPALHCPLTGYDIVNCNPMLVSIVMASLCITEPLLPPLEPDEDDSEEEEGEGRVAAEHKQTLLAILETLDKHAGAHAEMKLQDPAPLLHGGEEGHALATTSTERLLLRWVNVQLNQVYHRPVENFGSDLQDGVALGLLMRVVAPDIVDEEFSSNYDDRVEQIPAVAARCADFELLTPTALIEGQSDVLAAFLAQLFLARPNLNAQAESMMEMHVKLLEATCQKGYEAVQNPGEENKNLMEYCRGLEADWSEVILAFQSIQEVNRTMEGLRNRMHSFLGDTLAHRARGQPRTMLDAKEAREFLFYTSLSPDHLSTLNLKDSVDSTMVGRIEEVLRKHFRLLREAFRHYATGPGGGHGITLEGLLRLYSDCKLRSRDLCPHHLEVIFHDHVDPSAADKVITPQGFVEVLIQCANMKFNNSIENLWSQVLHLIENHLTLHSGGATESVFQRMAYDPRVREVLESHSKELKIVFDLYASLDASSTEALQRFNTMNITEFLTFLQHCDMLDETLTEQAVHQIFDAIQQSAISADGGEAEGGLDDDEELSFSEFLDGLVAITAYKFPDPFTRFDERVDYFLLQLFASLRTHWSRKRTSPKVNAMVNALQKKLRELPA